MRLIEAAVVAAVLSLLGTAVAADTFDIKGPEVERGKRSVELNTSYFSGFPANADRLRYSAGLEVGYGVTDWLKLGAQMAFDKPIGDDFQVSTGGVQGQIALRKLETGLGLAWYTGVDFRIDRDETNTLAWGPILQFGTEKTSLTLNPFFEKTFGANREQGVAFAYGWGAKTEVREGFSIGIEGYGTIPNIGDAPSTSFQEHRIGPVAYFERPLGGGNGGKSASLKDAKTAGNGTDASGADGPTFALEAGVLLGLTDATQDVTFKLKGGITW